MDYIKTNYIEACYNGYPHDSSAPAHLFAEVAIIDDTHEAMKPLLYILKKEALDSGDLVSIAKDLLELPGDAFMLAGEVQSVDKKRKQVHLWNQQSVSYNYLILASGTQQYHMTKKNDGFFVGLQALVDALRIRKISSQLPQQHTADPSGKHSKFMIFDVTNANLPSSVQNIFSQKEVNEVIRLANARKYLYEVVI